MTEHVQKRAEKRESPDWSRFGLSHDQQQSVGEREQLTSSDRGVEASYQHSEIPDDGHQNELFREQGLSQKPWWKMNFFISEPVLFGTWDGVFTSCMINILGVVIFLRMGWIIGNAGVGYTVLVIILSVTFALVAALSAIGVCERCCMGSGGIYFLFSHILGARIGGALGIVYCFAQAVSCSLAVMGFGESIMGLMHTENRWVARGIAIGLTLLLLVINVAGVKWVIRLQLVLLMALFLSTMDLILGSFIGTDPENGVIGYNVMNLHNNTEPDYLPGENFFTIFGLFFSTVTGILAGINMSGDLQDPFHNIPTGTLSALGVSFILYLFFTVVLGATCVRDVLQHDYMIAQKVSLVGVLWLSGLYISSVSSCMGSLYGPPRILQSIANENTIPIIKILRHGRGPNKVPVYALIVIFLIIFIFILIGDVNSLAPVVTTAFMMTYAAIDYAYFTLAMSYDTRQKREYRYATSSKKGTQKFSGYGAVNPSVNTTQLKDSFEKIASDLDSLFPERLQHTGHHLVQSKSPSEPTTPMSADFDVTKQPPEHGDKGGGDKDDDDMSQLLDTEEDGQKQHNPEIIKQPRSWYSIFCNRWVSFVGALVCVVVMFSINWLYALAEVSGAIVIYIYIGQASPGYFPGIAEFNLYEWIKCAIKRCFGRGDTTPEHIVVTPSTPAVNTTSAQLTEDNEDFAERGRYHQSETLENKTLMDYDSN